MYIHWDSVKKITFPMIILLFTAFWQGCAHHFALPDAAPHTVYLVEQADASPFSEWAPAFIAHGHGDSHNKIGKPVSVEGKVQIDTQQPVVYVMKRSFNTKRASYTNLIYRIHFPEVPFSLIPFNLTTGENVGLMVVVTLNACNQPVLITTVHTCGCYKAFTPTDYLADDALPPDWPRDDYQTVYGEHLPARLDYGTVKAPVLLVHLRPDVHRVMNLEVVNSDQLHSELYRKIALTVSPMAQLTQLPTYNGTTSFFYSEGWRKGYVKGSVKPFEMVLMSLISWDLFVGSDKIYADPKMSGNHFYTSLKPWSREESDMWDFARFLAYWGWKL